jgi:hypothetical protein
MFQFLGIIFGAGLSIGTAIVVEYLRRPSLRVELLPPIDATYPPGTRPVTNMRSLHAKLYNRTLPRGAKWMLRAPALQCRAMITFHYLDDEHDLFGRAMEGRWSDTPQPIPIVVLQNPDGQQLGLFPELSRGVDVLPGDSAELDILIRADDDDDCYGWNNESYYSTPLWRNPRWQLPRGRHLVKVEVTSSGQKVTRWFRLENSAARTDCRLEPYSPRFRH